MSQALYRHTTSMVHLIGLMKKPSKWHHYKCFRKTKKIKHLIWNEIKTVQV